MTSVRWPWCLHQEQMGLERWVLAYHMAGLGLKRYCEGEGPLPPSLPACTSFPCRCPPGRKGWGLAGAWLADSKGAWDMDWDIPSLVG